jgi:hypothetical protein
MEEDLLEEATGPYLLYNKDENGHDLLHLNMISSHVPDTKTVHHSAGTRARVARSMISRQEWL